MTVRVYRQSSIKKFKRCRRSWELSYRRNLGKPMDGTTLSGGRDVGTIVHLALEAYYNGADHTEALAQAELQVLQSALEAGSIFEGQPLPDDWQAAFNLASIMVEGYVQWVAEEGMDVAEETLAVEQAFELGPIPALDDEVYVTGRIDRIYRNTESGVIGIEDWKTRDQFGNEEVLQIDDQLLTYVALARANGFEPTEARHTQLRKVKRTARATPPFYRRVSIPVSQVQFESHLKHLSATLTEMVNTERALEMGGDPHLYVFPNPTRDCSWDCDFLPVCSMADDGSDFEGVLQELYIVKESA